MGLSAKELLDNISAGKGLILLMMTVASISALGGGFISTAIALPKRFEEHIQQYATLNERVNRIETVIELDVCMRLQSARDQLNEPCFSKTTRQRIVDAVIQ